MGTLNRLDADLQRLLRAVARHTGQTPGAVLAGFVNVDTLRAHLVQTMQVRQRKAVDPRTRAMRLAVAAVAERRIQRRTASRSPTTLQWSTAQTRWRDAR